MPSIKHEWRLESMSALAFKNDFPDPVRTNGFLVPETFETKFIFSDSNNLTKSDYVWSVHLFIKIREAGTPAPLEVRILGLSKDEPLAVEPKYPVNRLPVESWQLEICNKYLNEMLKLSLAYGIEYLRYEEDPNSQAGWSLPLKVNRNSLGESEWKLGSRGYGNTDIIRLRKQIEKNLDRRSLSNEDHLLTSNLYKKELERAKRTGTKAKTSKVISEYFGITEDGADYRVKQAREKGFLPDKTKVSADKAGSKKPTNRKEKKNEPTQNRRTKGRDR